jgi:hypothetical protein
VPGGRYQLEGNAGGTAAEVRRFMTLSGERWREAHVAGGADETQARQVAERTIAACTGAPAPSAQSLGVLG